MLLLLPKSIESSSLEKKAATTMFFYCQKYCYCKYSCHIMM